MATVATWKAGFSFKADAQKVADEILALGDEVTPHQIVERAKDESTELHKCFDWDNDLAAEKWRLHQARQVVCMLVIKEDPVPTTRPSVRLFYKPSNSTGYKPTAIVLQKQDDYKKLLERAYAELRVFKAKYSMLKELDELLSLID